jgi:hypothetical protein
VFHYSLNPCCRVVIVTTATTTKTRKKRVSFLQSSGDSPAQKNNDHKKAQKATKSDLRHEMLAWHCINRKRTRKLAFWVGK